MILLLRRNVLHSYVGVNWRVQSGVWVVSGGIFGFFQGKLYISLEMFGGLTRSSYLYGWKCSLSYP